MSIPSPFNKGAPDAPDYKGAADLMTRANRPNQSTPWASSTWSRTPVQGHYEPGFAPGTQRYVAGDPTQGDWTQKVALAGPLDQANQSMMGQLGSAWASPLDSGADARNKAEQAIYGREAARLDPMWDQRQHGVNTDLANQGIDPNSEAYSKAQGVFGRGRNDAYSSALMDAIMGGGQEAQRAQGMDLQRRMAPLGAMAGLRDLSGMPTPGAAGNYLGAAGLQGQYGMDAAKQNQSFWADVMNGGIALKGAFSDERLKEDIRRHSTEILPGVPLASFRYKWEPEGTNHLGVIAQDLEAHYPDLVTYRDGYRCVPARFLLT